VAPASPTSPVRAVSSKVRRVAYISVLSPTCRCTHARGCQNAGRRWLSIQVLHRFIRPSGTLIIADPVALLPFPPDTVAIGVVEPETRVVRRRRDLHVSTDPQVDPVMKDRALNPPFELAAKRVHRGIPWGSVILTAGESSIYILLEGRLA
jgi:hypothetical protein